MHIKVITLDKKEDSRGWFAEILREEQVGEVDRFGQFYVTTAVPGKTKGNHYHKRKTEWFCVIKGKALLKLKKKDSNEEQEIEMGDKNFVLVKIEPHIIHAIKNIGNEEMILVAHISEPYNSDDPDTFYETILE